MYTNKQLFLMHVGQTSDSPMMLEIDHAEGVYMYSPDGKKYLDLISGVSVSNTGHCHPEVVKAVSEQVSRYMHLMVYGEIVQSPQVKYAESLAGLLPPTLNSCYFVNSGSEAVEGAIKLAKRFTGRSRIVYFRNAYHGSTHGSLSVQGSENFRNAFRPLLPDTFMADINDKNAASLVDDHTACVIIEPVQGEGGVIDAGKELLRSLREKCTQTRAILIFDEAQTGFGRTGTMFAFERYDIVPDVLILAKALGGGMPLGAFISSLEIMSCLASEPVLGHITTFGGHPVCCAAGLASLDIIIKEDLVKKSNYKSELFRKELTHPLIEEVRGNGLLLAVKLARKELVSYAVKFGPDYGIILDYFLFCEDAFRIAPPLTINEDEIKFACRQVKRLLDSAQNDILQK